MATGVLDVGGSDEVVAFLGRRLPEHGIDTHVLYAGETIGGASGTGGRLASALRQEGVRTTLVGPAAAERLITCHRPDVISAHGAPDWWIKLASRHGIPYVETLHGMHSFFGANWRAEAVRSTQVSRIVAVSELVRQQYLGCNQSIDPVRVITVPNSVDHRRMPCYDSEECRRWLNLDDHFLFLSLARHAVQKNNFGLLRAFDEVAATHVGAHLLIAGRPDDTAYAQQLRRFRAGLRCRDRIHLRDHAPWPAALLAAADAFVLDSFFEGWSLASMEALYAGVPVVVSDVGGGREQIGSRGGRGYLVGNPVGDPLAVNWETIRDVLYSPQPNQDELVSAMRAMIDDRETWTSRRRQLREESVLRFHPDRALSGHAAVLRDAVAAPVG